MQSRGDLGAGIALTSPEIILIITLMIMIIAVSTIVMILIIMMPISMMNLKDHLRARGAETVKQCDDYQDFQHLSDDWENNQ